MSQRYEPYTPHIPKGRVDKIGGGVFSRPPSKPNRYQPPPTRPAPNVQTYGAKGKITAGQIKTIMQQRGGMR